MDRVSLYSQAHCYNITVFGIKMYVCHFSANDHEIIQTACSKLYLATMSLYKVI